MPTFTDAREAKEFIVSRIVTEAQAEGIAVTEIERKMLYFSETAWTVPDIAEVNDTFEREYSQPEYELKMAGLIGRARANAHDDQAELAAWTEAVRLLRQEDHYLLVLIDSAGSFGRPRGDQLKLWAVALIIVCVVIAIAFVVAR